MWLTNVKSAIFNLFIWQSFLELLINIDRLGNSLCGGDPRATVSGRVGYFAATKKNPYWRLLQVVINFAFRPIDGIGHCYKAWHHESIRYK